MPTIKTLPIQTRLFYVGAGAVTVSAVVGGAAGAAIELVLNGVSLVQAAEVHDFPIGQGPELHKHELVVSATLTLHGVGGQHGLRVVVSGNAKGKTDVFDMPITGADGDTVTAPLHIVLV